jgi:hypothetical protein
MVNYTDIFQLKARLNKLKHQLDSERVTWQEKALAHKYLNKAMDYVNELRLH